MDPVLAVVIVLCALLAAAVVIHAADGRRPKTPLVVGEPVIVCTRRPDDQSIHGVVGRQDAAGITLVGARYLEPDGTSSPIGAVWLPAEAVAFVQTGVEPVGLRSKDAVGTPAVPVPLPDTRLAAARAAREG